MTQYSEAWRDKQYRVRIPSWLPELLLLTYPGPWYMSRARHRTAVFAGVTAVRMYAWLLYLLIRLLSPCCNLDVSTRTVHQLLSSLTLHVDVGSTCEDYFVQSTW